MYKIYKQRSAFDLTSIGNSRPFNNYENGCCLVGDLSPTKTMYIVATYSLVDMLKRSCKSPKNHISCLCS